MTPELIKIETMAKTEASLRLLGCLEADEAYSPGDMAGIELAQLTLQNKVPQRQLHDILSLGAHSFNVTYLIHIQVLTSFKLRPGIISTLVDLGLITQDGEIIPPK